MKGKKCIRLIFSKQKMMLLSRSSEGSLQERAKKKRERLWGLFIACTIMRDEGGILDRFLIVGA